MRYYKTISLQKVIQTNLGKAKAEKYLNGIDSADMVAMANFESDASVSSVNIYQSALNKLLAGEMEKTINYLIYGLDIDRSSKLLFSLCKNLVFTINKQLEGNNETLLRNTINIKNPNNLDKERNILKNKIKETEKAINQDIERLEKLEIELFNSKPSFLSVRKLYITYQIKKNKMQPEIKRLKESVNHSNSNLIQLKSDLAEAEKITVLKEYQKVLGLTLEVCIFPDRFQTNA